VSYKRYWVDEERGRVFCLVDAPDAETASRVHREAHGCWDRNRRRDRRVRDIEARDPLEARPDGCSRDSGYVRCAERTLLCGSGCAGEGVVVADTGDTGFMAVMAVRHQTAQDGRARLELDATDEHLNKAGTVHGGVFATLVDMAMGQALRSRTGDDEVPATSQLTVTYLRPGKPGTLVVSAQVRKQGENLSVCEADVEQDDRPLVHAIATFAVLHR
jgi:uncharacterized protein (TIGR00369 family)